MNEEFRDAPPNERLISVPRTCSHVDRHGRRCDRPLDDRNRGGLCKDHRTYRANEGWRGSLVLAPDTLGEYRKRL